MPWRWSRRRSGSRDLIRRFRIVAPGLGTAGTPMPISLSSEAQSGPPAGRRRTIIAAAALSILAVPAFADPGKDQFAAVLGLDDELCTMSGLIRLDDAISETDQTAIRWSLPNGPQAGAPEDSALLTPPWAQPAASLGLDPARCTAAEPAARSCPLQPSPSGRRSRDPSASAGWRAVPRRRASGERAARAGRRPSAPSKAARRTGGVIAPSRSAQVSAATRPAGTLSKQAIVLLPLNRSVQRWRGGVLRSVRPAIGGCWCPRQDSNLWPAA